MLSLNKVFKKMPLLLVPLVLSQCAPDRQEIARSVLSRAMRAKEASDSQEETPLLTLKRIVRQYLYDEYLLELMDKHRKDKFPLKPISDFGDTKSKTYVCRKAAVETFNEKVINLTKEEYESMRKMLVMETKRELSAFIKNYEKFKEKNDAKK